MADDYDIDYAEKNQEHQDPDGCQNSPILYHPRTMEVSQTINDYHPFFE